MGWRLPGLGNDLRYGARRLLHAPSFTALAVLVLALGVGVNASFFSLVNGALFKPVHIPKLPQLVNITVTEKGEIHTNTGFTSRRLERLEERNPTSVRLVPVEHFDAVLFQGGSASPVMAEGVTGSYFPALGVRPLIGRLLTPADDTAGSGGPAVISARAWRRFFAADPGVVGRSIRVSGELATIVGVAEEGFNGLIVPNLIGADLWLPWSGADPFMPKYRDGALFLLFAELQSGRTVRDADREMRSLGAGIEPGSQDLGLAAVPATAALLPTQLATAQALLSVVLLAVSGLVLLTACANLSGLLLARSAGRRTEIAIRMALGASRAQVFQMQLAETGLLTAAAGAVGYALAVLASKALSSASTLELGTIVASVNATPDLRVFLFALFVASGTTLIVGLAPAARLAETSPLEAWADSAGGSSVTPRATHSRTRLIAFQMATSLVLLVLAALFARSVFAAQREISGPVQANIVAGRVDFRMQKIAQKDWPRAIDRLLDASRIQGGPFTAFSSGVPGGAAGDWTSLAALGADSSVRARSLTISPSFFRVIGEPIISGREFSTQDAAGGQNAAILNDVAADDLWPDHTAVGRQVRLAPDRPPLTVVGVVRSTGTSAGDRRYRRFVFLPLSQNPVFGVIVLQRAAPGEPSPVLTMKAVVAAASPELALFDVKPISEYASPAVIGLEYGANVLSAAGFLGFSIALVGLYGVVTYAVTARTREFGIMRALGADGRDIRWLVLKDALRLLLAGIVPGLLIALVAALSVGRWLIGVPAYDPVTFILVPGAMAVVGVLASLIPAYRASRLDPIKAIRHL